MTPLPKAFDPNSVAEMSDEELLRIGSEPADQTFYREKLMGEAKVLRQSLADLQRPV